MSTESEIELAECLANSLRPFNDVDDEVATSSCDCNYENYEEFSTAVDMELFETDFKHFLKDLLKKTEGILVSGEKCDVRNAFSESEVETMKFNLFIWHFLENGKRSDSSREEVELGVLAASCYIAMLGLTGSKIDLYQIGLYNLCLKITRNCCQTLRIGETVSARKTGKKKAVVNETTAAGEDEAESTPSNAVIGPPRISVDSAERYLIELTNQFFTFLNSENFSMDPETQMATFELIEEIGRVELDSRTAPKACRAEDVRKFRSIERFTDRYCAFVHCLTESKYSTKREMAFGRLIRPRLALLPYSDAMNSSAKISTERKRAGELAVSLILSRIAQNPAPKELKLIQTILMMVYSQCPDYAEFRTNISQFIYKILEALPYQYTYDFVQAMNVMFKGRNVGVKSLSNELANLLIGSYDFSAPDPGPVPELDKENEEEEEVEAEQEEDPPATTPQPNEDLENMDDSNDDDDDDDDDDDGNKSRRKREKKKKTEEERKKKKKEKKAKEVKNVERIDAAFVLYNIVYMACIDKAAAMRIHGAHSLAKILDSETDRKKFQEFCQVANAKLDEKLGDIGTELEESIEAINLSADEGINTNAKNKKPADMLLNDQHILEKWNRLKKINKGEQRTEKDIIYMLVRRLATDDKAPVKKSACVLLKIYLSFCEEQVKSETVLSILQTLCRDKIPNLRKISAEAFTDLMLCDNLNFKDILSSKWLNSLISMLNDTDSDVVEHARKLIMKVLNPLLEHPTDLTWTLLNTIESTTNHRNYLMTTLRDAAREKNVPKSVLDSMKRRINETSENVNGAWMVFSQLCVHFHQNADFAIEEFKRVDRTKESELVKYMTHAIENNLEKIDTDAKQELIEDIQSDLRCFTLHPSHAKNLYYFLGRLMNGIGEKSKKDVREFQDFGEELLVKCFDTIVQSFDMFKDKDEWKRNSESQERLLCTSLHVAIEVFSFSPTLVPRHERLGKTLSLIVNSNDSNCIDSSTINPDMPIALLSRPQTQMSEVHSSQKTTGGITSHEGILFSENVRAISVLTLSNMILAYDRLLRLMPMLVKQLQYNPSYQIRSNIVVSIGDICASYKTDRYAPMLAAALCDPSVLVRRHAINQIARLISLGIFRFNGEIMIRIMMATLDADVDVRQDAKLYISEVLQAEDPAFFKTNFVQYMIALTQAKRLVGVGHDEDDRGQIDVAIGGGQPLARPSRIAIYTFMIESLDDRARFDVKMSICQRVFMPVVNGEYNFGDESVQCLLNDALLIMASSEMQIKMEVGKNNDENAVEDPSPGQVAHATDFLQAVYLEHYMETIVPSLHDLREFLNQHRSPLQRKCLLAFWMICVEHSKDIDKILENHRQLKDEILFEMNRVKQRSEEAHRILNEAIKKVQEFNKRQKRVSLAEANEVQVEQAVDKDRPPAQAENADVEMTSPAKLTAPNADESMKTPTKKRNPLLDELKTPATALRSRTEERSTPQSRLLSPQTLKKIRRSVGALIQTGVCLNAPNLEDTHVPEEGISRKATRANKTMEKEKIDVEEEPMDHDGSPTKNEEDLEKTPSRPEKVTEEDEPMSVEQEDKHEDVEPVVEAEKDSDEEEEDTSRRRSRRRKTPNYDDNESVDADGRVWKKPKVGTKSPEKDVNISSNVTLRRSRRGRPSEPEVVEKQKDRKRKASSDDDEEEQQAATTSDNVENAPRGMTPLVFDESKLVGRQCSTPIKGRSSDTGDVTFSLNISAITEREELKNRKSAAYHLQHIFEEDEEDEN